MSFKLKAIGCYIDNEGSRHQPFFFLPTGALPEHDSISLEPLNALAGEGVGYGELRAVSRGAV